MHIKTQSKTKKKNLNKLNFISLHEVHMNGTLNEHSITNNKEWVAYLMKNDAAYSKGI